MDGRWCCLSRVASGVGGSQSAILFISGSAAVGAGGVGWAGLWRR